MKEIAILIHNKPRILDCRLFELNELIDGEADSYKASKTNWGDGDYDVSMNFIVTRDDNLRPIVADCSIVKFGWGQNRHEIIGYFTYNKEYLCYEIVMLNAQIGKYNGI